jgi:hypothetical protein
MFDAYGELVKLLFVHRADYDNKYKNLLPILLKLCKKLNIQLIKGQLTP